MRGGGGGFAIPVYQSCGNKIVPVYRPTWRKRRLKGGWCHKNGGWLFHFKQRQGTYFTPNRDRAHISLCLYRQGTYFTPNTDREHISLQTDIWHIFHAKLIHDTYFTPKLEHAFHFKQSWDTYFTPNRDMAQISFQTQF